MLASWGRFLSSSLRANGSRECAPDDRLSEAIHSSACRAMDCFAPLAMTVECDKLARRANHFCLSEIVSSPETKNISKEQASDAMRREIAKLRFG
jgi:hypothetical protein